METVQAPLAAATAVEESEAGSALLPHFYTDSTLLEAEQELIFERTWQLAGHISALASPGSYITARAGSQPILVVRDEHRQLRAYRNVCRHRASRLLSGSGQCKGAIRCRYHGWTYRFDGTLIGVPEGLQFGERLDKSAHVLSGMRKIEDAHGIGPMPSFRFPYTAPPPQAGRFLPFAPVESRLLSGPDTCHNCVLNGFPSPSPLQSPGLFSFIPLSTSSLKFPI